MIYLATFKNAVGNASRRALTRELVGFYALTFGLSWGLGTLTLVVTLEPEGLAFQSLFYLAVFSPTLAALVMSFWRDGSQGARSLLEMFTRRTNYVRAVLAVLLVLPGSWALWGILERVLGTGEPTVDLQALFVGLPVTLVSTLYLLQDPGPLGEELGFRGYALPRLLALVPPPAAALVMGALHAFWHLPAFFVAGSRSERTELFVVFCLDAGF